MKQNGLTLFSCILFVTCLLLVACEGRGAATNVPSQATEEMEITQATGEQNKNPDLSASTAFTQGAEEQMTDHMTEPTNTEIQETGIVNSDPTEAPTEETMASPDPGAGGLPIL